MSTTDSQRRLDAANVRLSQELWLIHSSLAVYRVIGLNAGAIKKAGAFFGFVQNQSLGAVALGFGKVFEREREGRFELCSVSGVLRLAKAVQIENPRAAVAFSKKYETIPSSDWVHDVDQVFARQRPAIHSLMQAIDRVRDTRLAHLQQRAPEPASLPSIAAFEHLLAFAFDFHSFINEAFLNTHSHPTPNDKQVESSLLRVLEMAGVTDPRSQYE
jgi:hypothetical protein